MSTVCIPDETTIVLIDMFINGLSSINEIDMVSVINCVMVMVWCKNLAFKLHLLNLLLIGELRKKLLPTWIISKPSMNK